jgi:hypothetical protein
MLLAAVALVPVAPLQGSLLPVLALLPPLCPPLLPLRCTFSSPFAFALHSQQQAKVLCWRMRSGHKLRCVSQKKAQVANSSQRYFAGGCAPGIRCVALLPLRC